MPKSQCSWIQWCFFFIKKSLECEKRVYLFAIRDSAIFNTKKKNINSINSKNELPKQKENKTCILFLTKQEKIEIEGQKYLELNYNVQLYKKTHKGVQIWIDEGLYRFKVRLDSFNNPDKLEYTNGISPLDLTPKK